MCRFSSNVEDDYTMSKVTSNFFSRILLAEIGRARLCFAKRMGAGLCECASSCRLMGLLLAELFYSELRRRIAGSPVMLNGPPGSGMKEDRDAGHAYRCTARGDSPGACFGLNVGEQRVTEETERSA